jgi:hypothetical protein
MQVQFASPVVSPPLIVVATTKRSCAQPSLGVGLQAQTPGQSLTNAELRAKVTALEHENARLQADYKLVLAACPGTPATPSTSVVDAP